MNTLPTRSPSLNYYGIAIVVTALLVLLSWQIGIDLFKAILPAFFVMNPLTAVCFFLLGSWMIITSLPRGGSRLMDVIFAIAIVLVPASRMADLSGLTNFHADKLLFYTQLDGSGMAPPTALNFVFFAILVTVYRNNGAVLSRFKYFLLLPVGYISLLFLFGYLLDLGTLTQTLSVTSMALHTSVLFLLAVAGYLRLPLTSRFRKLFPANRPGGKLFLRLVPFFFLIPLVVTYLRLWGQEAGLYNTEFGAAIFLTTTFLLLSTVAAYLAAELNRADLERSAFEAKLSEQNRKLSASEALLAEHNDWLRSFSHILSHNLRNHSSNIYLITSIFEEESLNALNRELFEKLRIVSRDLNTTLDDLGTMLKIRDGSRIPAQPIRLDELLDKIRGVLLQETELYNIQITSNFQVKEVLFPAAYLESIFLNLLSNAIKYRRENVRPVITLTAAASGQGTLIQVQDNGAGIDLKRYGEKLFGLYHTFHGNDNARGVGLYLVKNQVESQGGSISVVSEPGVGSTFSIYIPLNLTGI